MGKLSAVPKELGIRAGERWAYKITLSHGPLIEVKVLDAGYNYESSIRVQRVDTGEVFWTRRGRLPAKWERQEEYLATHPQFRSALPEPLPRPEPQLPFIPRLTDVDLERIRAVVREEIAESMKGVPRIAFTVAELAYAVGLSDARIYQHIDRRDITPVYSGTKALIPVEEAVRFVRDLPDENYGALG